MNEFRLGLEVYKNSYFARGCLSTGDREICIVYQRLAGTSWLDSHQLTPSSSRLLLVLSFLTCLSTHPTIIPSLHIKEAWTLYFLRMDLKNRFPSSRLVLSQSITLSLLQTLMLWVSVFLNADTQTLDQ